MAYRKLGRNTGQRRALLRSLSNAILKNGRIKTTEPKAKELKSIVEKLITLGKQGDLGARRQAIAYLQDEQLVKELFDTISKKYTERSGGYTRMIKAENRRGDSAPMVIIELV